jgi:hypothetical protein
MSDEKNAGATQLERLARAWFEETRSKQLQRRHLQERVPGHISASEVQKLESDIETLWADAQSRADIVAMYQEARPAIDLAQLERLRSSYGIKARR